MESQNKTANWFVRALVSILCLLISAMIAYKFIAIEPKGEISNGIITLLLILLTLVLSESFDNFSIGKLISVTREVKKKENEVEKLEKQNISLFNQLISISNTQSQNQNHTNVYGDYHATASVQKATEADVQEKQSSEASNQQPETVRVSTNWRKAEQIAISKYLSQRGTSPQNAILEAKLVTQFHGIDPISNLQPVFDAYIKETEHETFVEIRPFSATHMMFRDRLYLMLSKINHYRVAQRVEAHLDLVLMKFPGEEPRSYQSGTRFLETFEPAIAAGLLKIHEIEFTAEEAALCREA